MRLEHHATPDERISTLVGFAKVKMLPLYMHARHSDIDIDVDMCITEPNNVSDSDNVPNANDLHDALQKLSQRNDIDTCQFTDAIGKHNFLVQRTDARQRDTRSLRFLLARARTLGGPNLFTPSEKWKLGYELVECVLPLLRTNWLSDLCSCAIILEKDCDRKKSICHPIRGRTALWSTIRECIQNAWCHSDWQ
jgi:hypothetical protein